MAIAETENENGALQPSEALAVSLAGIEKNYSIVRAATGTISLTREDSPEVKALILRDFGDQKTAKVDTSKTQQVKIALPNPHYERIRFTIEGQKLRFDGTFVDASRLVVIDGDEYQDYSPNRRRLTIKDRHFESRDYCDPREIFFNASLRLKDMLLKGNITNATLKKNHDGAGVLKIEFVTLEGTPYYVEFDSRVNYLPTKSIQFSRDSPFVESSGEIEYQTVDVAGTTAWFPKKLEFKLWNAKTKVTEKGAVDLSTGWRQKFSYLIGDLVLNPPLNGNEFKIEVPDGTLILNQISKIRYIYPNNQTARHLNDMSWWNSWWVSASLLVAMLVILGTVVRRRLGNSQFESTNS